MPQQPSAADAEKTYSKATTAELARDLDTAFRLYINAAESYLYLSRSDTLPEKARAGHKANAKKSLERAEKIKAVRNASKPSSSPGGGSAALQRVPIRHLSVEQQSRVLRSGSRVNGQIYQEWSTKTHSSSEDLHSPPAFSPDQIEHGALWRAPSNVALSQEPFELLPQDIIQRVVTDCSLCASLSAYVEYCRRFQAVNVLRDQLSQDNPVRISIKLFFNGTWRRIVIDSELPHHSSENNLLCMSCGNHLGGHSVLWPSYIEKAYMTLMGGYDFPGSDSSTDLHTLLGWIPEHIGIRSSHFQSETTWSRLFDNFNKGHCVVTLGTGSSPPQTFDGISLLPSHNYAITGIEETLGERTVTFLDSWVSDDTGEAHNAKLSKVAWDDVLNSFEGLYLSWNPDIWTSHLIFHGSWQSSLEGQPSSGSTHQMTVNVSRPNPGLDAEIWVLLSRHTNDTKRNTDFICVSATLEETSAPSQQASSQLSSSKNVYTNGLHSLRKIMFPSSHDSGALFIQCDCDSDSTEVGFTLSVYAVDLTLAWEDTRVPLPYAQTVQGSLTTKNAGGNFTYPTFMMNPQYNLRIHANGQQASTSSLETVISLQSDRENPVNILGVWGTGERVTEVLEASIAFSSGAYTYGHTRVRAVLRPGTYTIIVSTFEPHHTGPFSLSIESQAAFDISPILQEGAGMYTSILQGSWTRECANGAPKFGKYWENPRLTLNVPATSHVKLRLQLLKTSPAALNVALFPDGSNQPILTSGPYDSASSGVCTDKVVLKAGKYTVIPSTHNPGVEESFKIYLYSSTSGVTLTS